MDWLRSTILIDAIVVLLLCELLAAAVLVAPRARAFAVSTGLNALAGAGLLLAMRAAVTDASAVWIGVCLLGALAAHVADLRWRWQRRG